MSKLYRLQTGIPDPDLSYADAVQILIDDGVLVPVTIDYDAAARVVQAWAGDTYLGVFWASQDAVNAALGIEDTE